MIWEWTHVSDLFNISSKHLQMGGTLKFQWRREGRIHSVTVVSFMDNICILVKNIERTPGFQIYLKNPPLPCFQCLKLLRSKRLQGGGRGLLKIFSNSPTFFAFLQSLFSNFLPDYSYQKDFSYLVLWPESIPVTSDCLSI